MVKLAKFNDQQSTKLQTHRARMRYHFTKPVRTGMLNGDKQRQTINIITTAVTVSSILIEGEMTRDTSRDH